MMRLQRQGTVDVGDRLRVIAEQVVDSRALVPALGEIGRLGDDGVEDLQRGAEIAQRQRLATDLIDLVEVGIAGFRPD
jgi:hypothetical protein